MSSTSRGEQSPRWSDRQSGPHKSSSEDLFGEPLRRVDLTIGTARDRGSPTARRKAPRTEGGALLFAEHFSTRGSQTCSIVPAVSMFGGRPSRVGPGQKHGSPASLSFPKGVHLDARRVRSPVKGGECPCPRGNPRARGHAAITRKVVVDVTGTPPQSPAPQNSKASRREDRASGRPRSRCVVRRVSPHRAVLADDDERCRVSVRSARVVVGPRSTNKGPHDHRNEQAAGTAGHVPLPTFWRERSRWNTVRTAPLEQAVSGGRPERHPGSVED